MAFNRSQKLFFGITLGVLVLIAIVFLSFGKGNVAKKGEATIVIWGVSDTQGNLQSTFNSFKEYIKTVPGYERFEITFSYRKWGEEEYEDLLLNQLAEGEGPDIMFIHNTWLSKHHGKLATAPANISTLDNYQNTFAPVAFDDLIYNDEIYAMPLYIDTLGIYYNVDHFRTADFSSVKPAATWDEIQNQLKQLVIRDSSPTGLKRAGLAIGSSENVTNSVDIFYLMLAQHGVSICDAECTRATFNDPEMEEGGGATRGAEKAFQLLSSFTNKEFAYYTWHPKYLTDLDLSYDRNEIDAFVEGKVSMIIGYSDIYDEIENRSERNNVVFEIAPIPQLLDPNETGYSITYANYWAPGVNKFSNNKDLAWEFIKYATSKDQLNNYYNTTNRPTSRLDLMDFQQAIPRMEVWATQIKDAKSLVLFDHSEFDRIFQEAIDEIISRDSSIREVLEESADRVNKVLFNFSTL